MPVVYLVTGSNRGIGLGATAFLAARPDTIVYAGARDVAGATALNELKKQYSGLRPVQLDTTSEKDIKAVAELIKSEEGKIDVVLANAGIALEAGPISGASIELMRKHYEVNTLGPVMLYQAVRPLLSKGAVFGVTSSATAMLSVDVGVPVGSYGASKAALNYIVTRIGFEDKDIVAVAIHPGVVNTDMGKASAAMFGMKAEDFPDVIDQNESGKGVVAQLDEAARTKVSGRFVNWKGDVMPW